MNINAIVISNNKNTIDLINMLLEENGKFSTKKGFENPSDANVFLSKSSNTVVIVDISDYQEQGLNFVSKISADYPNSRIITISDKQDVNLIIRSMRVGACDFIPMPIIKSQFMNIIDKVYNDLTGNTQKKSKCKIISVYSNKGGVGKTSIATNLAVEIAKITKENVAIID